MPEWELNAILPPTHHARRTGHVLSLLQTSYKRGKNLLEIQNCTNRLGHHGQIVPSRTRALMLAYPPVVADSFVTIYVNATVGQLSGISGV